MTTLDLDALDLLGDLLEWGATDEPWRYFRDAAPKSAYVEWVEACDPTTIRALIACVRAAEEALRNLGIEARIALEETHD